MAKRIAYIGDFEKVWNEEGNARAFESLGFEVDRYQESTYNHQADTPKLIASNPDLVLWAKLKVQYRTRAATDIHNAGLRTACWHFDLYWGLSRQRLLFNDPMFVYADTVFSPDGGNDERFKIAGLNHHLVRQGIAKEYAYLGNSDPQYNYDVVFVGSETNSWPYRRKLCDFLSRRYGAQFHWFGRRDTNEVRGHYLNNLCATARIIIGDSVYSPRYWSNRVFETIGRGGFLIHPMIEGFDEAYTPGEHVVTYRFEDFDGLASKIDYYLEQEKESLDIADAGLAYTLEHHMLENRALEIKNILNL